MESQMSQAANSLKLDSKEENESDKLSNGVSDHPIQNGVNSDDTFDKDIDKDQEEASQLLNKESQESKESQAPVGTNSVSTENETEKNTQTCCSNKKNTVALIILVFANMLNYMDRYTIFGVLLDVQQYYSISNASAGLLQTVFIVFYMVSSPLFGYLGDRWNRKYLMIGSVAFWAVFTLIGSFIPSNLFWVFLFLRGFVGVGEACFSTIAPAIIADLFVGDCRSIALYLFYFAIPVGSGLGYVVGGAMSGITGEWQWALRATPGLCILCVALTMIFIDEPPRGQAEGGTNLETTSVKEDMKYLMKNKSFILSTLGFTCVSFATGALSVWAPPYFDYSVRLNGYPMSSSEVSLYFGIVTCVAGFLGVGIGSESARRIRVFNPRADPLVCAVGLLVSVPFLYAVLILSRINVPVTWVFVLIGEVFLCFNWAIVADILLYVIVPTRRSSATAVQILVSHILGDAISPYLVGAVSDFLRTDDLSIFQNYYSLQNSLYMTVFVGVFGGAFFLANALFIEQDKANVQMIIKQGQEHDKVNGKSAELAIEIEMKDVENGEIKT